MPVSRVRVWVLSLSEFIVQMLQKIDSACQIREQGAYVLAPE